MYNMKYKDVTTVFVKVGYWFKRTKKREITEKDEEIKEPNAYGV